MSHTDTPTPPERFNFARHLIALNAGRAGKTALIDDAGTLTYGQLADQVQRMRGQVDQASPLAALTQTQFAVLRLVTQGYTTPRIAEMRGTTTSAVEKVLGSIYDALEIPKDDGISRRSEAMRIFVEYAGLPPRD